MPSKATNTIRPAVGELDIVQDYKTHLHTREYSPSLLGKWIRTVIHLLTWWLAKGKQIETLDIRVLHQFLNHHCTCPGPHGYRKNFKRRARWLLHQFLGYLIETGRVRMPVVIESGSHTVESFLQSLEAQGYVHESVVAYRKRCRHFIVWLYFQNIELINVQIRCHSAFK